MVRGRDERINVSSLALTEKVEKWLRGECHKILDGRHENARRLWRFEEVVEYSNLGGSGRRCESIRIGGVFEEDDVVWLNERVLVGIIFEVTVTDRRVVYGLTAVQRSITLTTFEPLGCVYLYLISTCFELRSLV